MNMPVSLVVDDEPAVRTLIRAILQRENFQILEAGAGSQAFQIVQELEGSVDLIVSDIQMPNGDGLSLAQAVRDAYPSVPLILISGQVRPDAAFEFVQKPFLPATLLQAVRRLFAPKLVAAAAD